MSLKREYEELRKQFPESDIELEWLKNRKPKIFNEYLKVIADMHTAVQMENIHLFEQAKKSFLHMMTRFDNLQLFKSKKEFEREKTKKERAMFTLNNLYWQEKKIKKQIVESAETYNKMLKEVQEQISEIENEYKNIS